MNRGQALDALVCRYFKACLHTSLTPTSTRYSGGKKKEKRNIGATRCCRNVATSKKQYLDNVEVDE
jgi:hypothetical protein